MANAKRDILILLTAALVAVLSRFYWGAFIIYLAGLPIEWLVDHLKNPVDLAVHHPSFPFWCLFVFRYLRLVVHIISFWFFYKPTPLPRRPTLFPKDVTVILPTIDPQNVDFDECLRSCLVQNPGEIIIITVGQQLATLTNQIVAPYRSLFPRTDIQVRTTSVANKRIQVAHGVRFAKGKVTVLLDDHVFWPSSDFLCTILAPFENDKVGAVGTNKRVRRTDLGFNLRSFWNMIGALYLERHNFEIRATNAIDGGVFVISGRTAAYRTSILQSAGFMDAFTNEKFFFGQFGPLNADDDNFLTREVVRRGYDIKIQYSRDAMIETTLGTYPKFLSQCLRWVRTTWRSNSASLFTDRTVWKRQPWCVYAVYLTSFVNFALFYDGALIYALNRIAERKSVYMLMVWIFCSKMVKLFPYFLREPQDLLMLPGYFAFAYYHSLIKLYAGLTFWVTAWGGRNLAAINTAAGGPGDDDDGHSSHHSDHGNDDNDDNNDGHDGHFRPPPPPSSSSQYRPSSSSFSGPSGWSSGMQLPIRSASIASRGSHIGFSPSNSRRYMLECSSALPGIRPSIETNSSGVSPRTQSYSATVRSPMPTSPAPGSVYSSSGSSSASYCPSISSVSTGGSGSNGDHDDDDDHVLTPRGPPSKLSNTQFSPYRSNAITFPTPPLSGSGIFSPAQRWAFNPQYSSAYGGSADQNFILQRERRALNIPDRYAKSWVRGKQCQCLHSDGDRLFKTRLCRCLVGVDTIDRTLDPHVVSPGWNGL